jgi:hypothetical protein
MLPHRRIIVRNGFIEAGIFSERCSASIVRVWVPESNVAIDVNGSDQDEGIHAISFESHSVLTRTEFTAYL